MRSRVDLDRERQVDRRAVGLERRVAPVALVLGLERLSLHPHLDLDAGRHLVQDRAHVAERLVRRDTRRKRALGAVAVDQLDDARTAGARLDRMQHAQPEPVAQEARAGRAAGSLNSMRPSARPQIAAFPRVADGAPRVPCHEADPERVGLGLDHEILELGGHGDPALAAQAEVDAAQYLALPEPDPAQLAAIEHHPQRSRAQRNRERGGGRCVNRYRILRAGAGHPSPPFPRERIRTNARCPFDGNRRTAFVVVSQLACFPSTCLAARTLAPAAGATGRPVPIPLMMEALTQ